MIRITTAALLLVWLAASAPVNAEPIELRYRLEPGQRWEQEQFSLLQLSTDRGPGTLPTFFSSTSVMRFEVKSVDANGDALIVYERVSEKFSVKTGDWTHQVDTSNPDPDAGVSDRLTAATMGATWRFVLSPLGVVKEVRDIEANRRRIAETLNARAAEDEADAIAKKVRERLSTASMRLSIQNCFVRYSGEPAGVGDAWHYREVVQFPPSMERVTMRVTAIDDDTCSIRGTAKLEKPGPDEYPDEFERPPFHDVAGTSDGVSIVDRATGLLDRYDARFDFTAVEELTHENDPDRGKRLPFKSGGKFTIRVKTLPPRTADDQPDE